MAFKYKIESPSVLIRIGAACLLFASLSRWFLHPESGVLRDLSDGVMGLLYGVEIGSLLMAVRIIARRKAGAGRRPCA